MEKLIDDKTAEVLKEHFEKALARDVEIQTFTEGKNEFAEFGQAFLNELAALNNKIKPKFLSLSEGQTRGLTVDPSFTIGENLGYKIHFNGTPAGHEANSLVEIISITSRGISGLTSEQEESIKKIDKPVSMKIFVTTICPYCPQSVIQAAKFAAANPEFISLEIVESQENKDLALEYNVSSVPLFLINNDKKSALIGVQPDMIIMKHILKYGSSQYESILLQLKKDEAKKLILKDNPEGVVYLTDGNFKDALSKYPRLVVDFWAEWCAPCRMMGTLIESLAAEYQGRVVYAKVNTDQNPVTANEYQIESIPSIIVFDQGKPVHTLVGALPKERLEEEINADLKVLKVV